MKNCSYLINVSRAEIVNMKDLYDALKTKKIQGAALDIRTCNFVNPKCIKFGHDLKTNLICYEETKLVKEMAQFPNVIVTPHIAYKTQDVMDYILEISIRGILDCIKGGTSFRAC